MKNPLGLHVYHHIPSNTTLSITPSRKSRARKQRQTRKSTQPVPADFLAQLTKHDREMELAEEAKSTSTSSVEDTTDGPQGDDHRDQSKVPSEVPAKKKDDGKQMQHVTMSAYRPSARPTPRYTAESTAAPAQSTWHPGVGKTKVSEAPEQASVVQKRKVSDPPEQKKMEGLVNSASKSCVCTYIIISL